MEARLSASKRRIPLSDTELTLKTVEYGGWAQTPVRRGTCNGKMVLVY